MTTAVVVCPCGSAIPEPFIPKYDPARKQARPRCLRCRRRVPARPLYDAMVRYESRTHCGMQILRERAGLCDNKPNDWKDPASTVTRAVAEDVLFAIDRLYIDVYDERTCSPAVLRMVTDLFEYVGEEEPEQLELAA